MPLALGVRNALGGHLQRAAGDGEARSEPSAQAHKIANIPPTVGASDRAHTHHPASSRLSLLCSTRNKFWQSTRRDVDVRLPAAARPRAAAALAWTLRLSLYLAISAPDAAVLCIRPITCKKGCRRQAGCTPARGGRCRRGRSLPARISLVLARRLQAKIVLLPWKMRFQLG